jgi:hypothetical protein
MISDTLYLPAKKLGNQLISPIHSSINTAHATLLQKVAQALHLSMWNVTSDTTTLINCCDIEGRMQMSLPSQPDIIRLADTACQESQNSCYDTAQFQIHSKASLPPYSDYKVSQQGNEPPSYNCLEESEEYESLPPYSCSVCKAGYLDVKQYMDKADKRSRNRSWR